MMRASRSIGRQALSDAAEYLLEQANRTVPHDEGTLMRSGLVTMSAVQMLAAISYDTPYAVRQHEDLSLRHAKGRRAKWLELTVLEERGAVIRYFRDAYDDL